MKKLLVLLILLSVGPVWADDVYIDPSAGADGNGTHTSPFNTYDSVTFETGDDYWQLCGTTYSGQVDIPDSADGTALDYIYLGHYYLDGGSPVKGTSPSWGNSTCANSDAKPIIEDPEQDHTGRTLDIFGDYVRVTGIHVKYGERLVVISGDNSEFIYGMVTEAARGVVVGQVSGYENVSGAVVSHNYVEYDVSHGDGTGCDGIQGVKQANGMMVEDNYIYNFAHACVGFHEPQSSTHGNNTARYNYCADNNGFTSECGIVGSYQGSPGNYFLHNWCQDAGDIHVNSSGNIVAGNVLNGINGKFWGVGYIVLQTIGDISDVHDNYIINNTIYNIDEPDTTDGIQITTLVGHTKTVEDNYIANNILLNIADDVFKISDGAGTVGTNYFYNNLAYGYSGLYYKDGTTEHSTHTALNAESFASNNLDSDPFLENPASSEFWTTNSGSPIFDAAYDFSTQNDDLLENVSTWPTSTATGSVSLVVEDPITTIGAYALSSTFTLDDLSPSTQQECGTDPQPVNVSYSTSVNAYCRKSTNPAHTTYASMSADQMANGEGTQLHNENVDQACGDSTTIYTMCNTAADGSGDSSERYQIIVDVASAAAPETVPPTTMVYGDGNTLSHGSGVTIQPAFDAD